MILDRKMTKVENSKKLSSPQLKIFLQLESEIQYKGNGTGVEIQI